MSAISWANLETFTAPPGSTSTASSGDDYSRSLMSSIALGLSTSYIWPGSGGGSAASGGVSQFGNARLSVATNSAVTGGHGNGYLLLNRNHVSLHHIGSTWTAMLGHSGMLDHGTPLQRWMVQTGSFSMDSAILGDSGSTNVAFPVAFSSTPSWVALTISGAGTTTFKGYAINVSVVSGGGFTSVYTGLRSGESLTNVDWQAIGAA